MSDGKNLKFVHPSREFTDYLNKKRISSFNEEDKSNVGTHVSMSEPKGVFTIPQNEIPIFNELYEKELKNGKTLGIMEKPNNQLETPLVADFDFKYEKKDGKSLMSYRKHTDKIVKNIVKCFNCIYSKNFSLNDKDAKNNCIYHVTQRDSPYESKCGKYIKDGIHIINPGYRAFPKIHLKMRNKIIKDKTLIKILKSLKTVNDINDIVDEAVICKNAWMLYGSRKPDKDVYKIAYSFDSDLKKVDLKSLNIKSYVEYFSFWRNISSYGTPNENIKNDLFNKQLLIPLEETMDESTDESDTDIPEQKVSPKEVKNNKTSKKKKSSGKKEYSRTEVIENDDPDEYKEEYTKNIYNLLNLLKKNRGTKKGLWIEVGDFLKSISKTPDQYLYLWVQFSGKFDVFTEDDCNKEWKNISRRKIPSTSLNTLKYWAKNDNKNKYIIYQRNQIRKRLTNLLNSTHVDIANILHLMFSSTFVCSSVKNSSWYQYKNHRWNNIDSGVYLRKKISTELAREYVRFRNFCFEMIGVESIDEIQDKELGYEIEDKELEEIIEFDTDWAANAKNCNDIIMKLKTKGFKDSLIGECKEVFYQEKFIEKLDERHELIGYENGVINLDAKIFRKGRPDDYITLSTKTNYIPDYETQEEYKEILNFFKQIYLTDNMVKYGLKERALMLHGKNFEERLYTHIGAGGNGKSKLRELMSKSFGEYVFGFPVTLFTGKRSMSSSATPEVARSKGKRIAYVDEPEHNTNFNIGLAKKFTGGDPIESRELYGNMFEFIPQFSITLLCNNIPAFPADDEGAQRRLTITEFQARFVERPDPNNKKEFPRDKDLSSKINRWKDVFSSMLVHYYHLYQEEGLNPPDEVTKFTKQFIKECDKYNEFITEKLIEVQDEKHTVEIKELYEIFRAWVEENGINTRKSMTKREFKKYIFKKINGKIRDNKIYGYRIREY